VPSAAAQADNSDAERLSSVSKSGLLQLISGKTASMTAMQIKTWGVTYDPFLAELKAQEAMAKGDKRLAHDILWDASNNDKGQNGWCIPDRGALNDAVNAWRGSFDDFSYATLSAAMVARGKQPLTLIGNPIVKATASIEILGRKEGKSGYVFEQTLTVGRTTTTVLDKKVSMGLAVAYLGIEASVCGTCQQQSRGYFNYL
jgi:hypothetical protein